MVGIGGGSDGSVWRCRGVIVLVMMEKGGVAVELYRGKGGR